MLGHQAWRLPTCDELVTLFRARLNLHQGWPRGFYWSSTKGMNGSHYVVNSDDGDIYVYDDDATPYHVSFVQRAACRDETFSDPRVKQYAVMP